jgi:hypothetical protein
MTEKDTSVRRDMAVGAVGAIPILGSILEPLAGRALDAVRAEWARNASTAPRALRMSVDSVDKTFSRRSPMIPDWCRFSRASCSRLV